MLARLEKIGYLCAVMGGESSSQRILDILKKDITPQQIENAIKVLSTTGIVPKISFMVGIPGETEEEILETYRFAILLKKIILKAKAKADIMVLAFRLYPGSLLFDIAKKEYDYNEKLTLEDLSNLDGQEMKKGWGFPTGDRKYIKNPKKFDLMEFYYSTFIWPYFEKGGVLVNILSHLVMLRFEKNFFRFSFFEKSLLWIVQRVKQ